MPLPISLALDGRLAVIAGGGRAASRKAAELAEAGARLRIVAPEISPELRESIAGSAAELRERRYESEDLTNAFLAIAASNDDAVNAAVVADARARGILVCDASGSARGDFSMQAAIRVGQMTFTVDTGGAAPAFAKRVAHEIGTHFGQSYAAAAATLARMRTYVKAAVPTAQRSPVLRELAQLPVQALASMNAVQAEHEIEATVARLFGAEAPARAALVCATRASALAMVQARGLAAKLAARGTATTFLPVTTTGDRIRDRSIAAIGAESLFVKELELALREGRAHYAVHSCKDLPALLPDDMHIAAISEREDPRDCFCSERYADFERLPPGAKVGTSSARRRAQLAALRPDLSYVDIRGNVDTRLKKLRDGEYDAIVLAAAGLRRLRASATYTVPFATRDVVPAPGQGALAVETRAGESALIGLLRDAINERSAELAVSCERRALAELRGGCQAPIGVHAYFEGDELCAQLSIATEDGAPVGLIERRARCTDVAAAEALGSAIARAAGESAHLPLKGKLVVLPRTQDRPSRIAAALRADGAEVIEMRSGDAAPAALRDRVPDIIVFPSSGSVAAAAPFLAGVHRLGGRPSVAAMGPASSAAAHAAGFTPDVVAPEAEVGALVEAVGDHLRLKEPLQ